MRVVGEPYQWIVRLLTVLLALILPIGLGRWLYSWGEVVWLSPGVWMSAGFYSCLLLFWRLWGELVTLLLGEKLLYVLLLLTNMAILIFLLTVAVQLDGGLFCVLVLKMICPFLPWYVWL